MENRPVEEQIVDKLESLALTAHKHVDFPSEDGEHEHGDHISNGDGQHRHSPEPLGALGSTALLVAVCGDELYDSIISQLQQRLERWEKKFGVSSRENVDTWYDSVHRLNSPDNYFDIDRHLWRLTFLFLEELKEYRHIVHTATG